MTEVEEAMGGLDQVIDLVRQVENLTTTLEITLENSKATDVKGAMTVLITALNASHEMIGIAGELCAIITGSPTTTVMGQRMMSGRFLQALKALEIYDDRTNRALTDYFTALIKEEK